MVSAVNNESILLRLQTVFKQVIEDDPQKNAEYILTPKQESESADGVTYSIYLLNNSDIIRNGNYFVDVIGNTQIVYIGPLGNTTISNSKGSLYTLVGLNTSSSFLTYINGAVLAIELNDFKINKQKV